MLGSLEFWFFTRLGEYGLDRVQPELLKKSETSDINCTFDVGQTNRLGMKLKSTTKSKSKSVRGKLQRDGSDESLFLI